MARSAKPNMTSKNTTSRNTTPKKVTIREVAKRAKVSVGTASRVINNVSNVSPRIQARVKDAIEKLNYKPDPVAQSMRSGESRTIGVLVRDINSTALATFVNGAQDVLNEGGYTLLLACSDERKERELRFLDTAVSRRVDGLIMTTVSETDKDLVAVRRQITLPVVLFDREIPRSLDSLLIGHGQGTIQALEHLYSLGHRSIALLTGDVSVYPARARVYAYQQFAAARGLKLDPQLLRTRSFSEANAFLETSALLGRARPPTALVLGGISMLPGALRAVRSHGLRIPEDISIVGSGESDLAMLASPAISVVRWDYAEVGRTCARLLLDRLKGTAPDTPRRILVPAEYVIRESCASPRKQQRKQDRSNRR
jgi:LacI family transcriptional regulator